MGQGDIIKILKQHGRPMTSSEIAKLLNQGKRSVNVLIKKLLVGEIIKKIEVNQKIMYELKNR